MKGHEFVPFEIGVMQCLPLPEIISIKEYFDEISRNKKGDLWNSIRESPIFLFSFCRLYLPSTLATIEAQILLIKGKITAPRNKLRISSSRRNSRIKFLRFIQNFRSMSIAPS